MKVTVSSSSGRYRYDKRNKGKHAQRQHTHLYTCMYALSPLTHSLTHSQSPPPTHSLTLSSLARLLQHLLVLAGVPARVKKDDFVSAREVDTKMPSLCGEEKHIVSAAVEGIDGLLSLLRGRRPVHSRKGNAAPFQHILTSAGKRSQPPVSSQAASRRREVGVGR